MQEQKHLIVNGNIHGIFEANEKKIDNRSPHENGNNVAVKHQELNVINGNAVVSNFITEKQLSWEIRNVDAVFENKIGRISDLTKEAMLQNIKDGDLRFLGVGNQRLYFYSLFFRMRVIRPCSARKSLAKNVFAAVFCRTVKCQQ